MSSGRAGLPTPLALPHRPTPLPTPLALPHRPVACFSCCLKGRFIGCFGQSVFAALFVALMLRHGLLRYYHGRPLRVCGVCMRVSRLYAQWSYEYICMCSGKKRFYVCAGKHAQYVKSRTSKSLPFRLYCFRVLTWMR